MNLGRAVLNSGSWKKIWTNYPNWIYTVKIFYHDVTFSRFAVGRNTLPKLGLKLTISWKSSLKGPDLQQSMIKGQFTKNGTFINILAILRPIWPQLCMLNKSASHLRTSFLVLVIYIWLDKLWISVRFLCFCLLLELSTSTIILSVSFPPSSLLVLDRVQRLFCFSFQTF